MFVRLVKLWIVISALASVGGWALSAMGVLNKGGYVGYAFVVTVILVAFLCSNKYPLLSRWSPVADLKKLKLRMRRFLPAGFGVLAALVFLSGLIHAPNDHTAMSYRLPRVLEWLSHGRWFWIHTRNYRMNDRACGIEWLSSPLLLFTKSDRALFLLNFIPFLLLPGLIFSVWTRLGVRPRVAWSWMWLMPTGYCFLLQAGGVANDAFPTVYALAMMDFALRGRRCASGQSSELNCASCNMMFSLLSAALLVGAKASNLPLGLPWAVVFLPLLPQLWRSFRSSRNTQHATRNTLHVFTWAFVFLTAVTISFIPTALLNIHYIHDWSGLSIEHEGMNMKNPLAGVLGNAVLLFTNNFVPTFFPLAGWWNQHALSHFPVALVRLMDANFEGGYNILGEMPTEDWAGIGFGISVLVLVSGVAGLRYRAATRNMQHATRANQLPTFHSRLVLLAPWIALLAYCMKTGMVTPARLIAPYYPLLLPALLIGAGQSKVVRRRWWQVSAGVVLLLALAALIVTPPRPLWPWRQVLDRALTAHPNQRQLLRAQKVYEVYAHRSDPLAGMRQWFPEGLKVIGFMGTDDDLDISLWKPYGPRRVERFMFDDPPEKIHELGIQYGVVSGLELDVNKSTIQDWLQKSGAELLNTTNATMTVSQGSEPWYFVRFKQ
jgi:hypothetical protein